MGSEENYNGAIRISVVQALANYFGIKQRYENQLPEDEPIDCLPQSELESFLGRCEQQGGPRFAEEVAARLGTSQRVLNVFGRVACHDSRKPFGETRP